MSAVIILVLDLFVFTKFEMHVDLFKKSPEGVMKEGKLYPIEYSQTSRTID